MALATNGAVWAAEVNSEPALRWCWKRSRRHQIAVLERSRTRRTCLRRWDRLFWILLSLLVAGLARKPCDGPDGDRFTLTSSRLVLALEISVTWSLARWAAKGFPVMSVI
jgi:hypothetical protein